MNILLVEDELLIAKDIETILTGFGYSVLEIVSSGEDAIKRAEAIKPDLIIMDVVLKGNINGIDAAKEIRTHFGIPVIFLTAYSDKNTLIRAISTEPFGYVLKPVNDNNLFVAIEIAMVRNNLEKEKEQAKHRLYTTLKSIGEAVISTDINENIPFIKMGWIFKRLGWS